jgi:hypothetical protein
MSPSNLAADFAYFNVLTLLNQSLELMGDLVAVRLRRDSRSGRLC